jgi:Viral BACON domain
VSVTILCAVLAACGGGGSKGGSEVLAVSQTTLTFSALFGIANDPAPAMVNVTNTGTGGALNFTATSDSSWLMVAPASGTTAGALFFFGWDSTPGVWTHGQPIRLRSISAVLRGEAHIPSVYLLARL